MSYRVSDVVWSASVARGPAKLVLLALATFADDYGRCWPSLTTLAARTGLGRRTVQRSLHELQALGELAVSPGRGRGNVGHYTIIVRAAEQPEKVSARHLLVGPEKVPNLHEKAPDRPEKVPNLSEKVSEWPTEPVKNPSVRTGQRNGHHLLPNPPPQAEEGTRQRRRRRNAVDVQDDAAPTPTQMEPLARATPEDVALWEQSREALRTEMTRANWETLIEPLEPLGRADNGGLTLRSPRQLGIASRIINHVRHALYVAGDECAANASIKEDDA